jgi:hypothetical protein
MTLPRAASSLSRDEWWARYKQRFIDRAGLTDAQAQGCVDAVSYEEVSDMFEDDPEGAADEEMSYWSE